MIEIKNLEKVFHIKAKFSDKKTVHAVRKVNLIIPDGGAISLIGESGCGKTTIGRMLCGLEKPTAGSIIINGQDISKLRRGARSKLLQKIQLIQQDPYQALNPTHTIYQMMSATLKKVAKEKKKGRDWVRWRMDELLNLVGLDPSTILFKYPHMLSGGQRQRVIIARALTVEPEILVADEIVSMIDVSLRLGILKLLRNLREQFNISILFITHDVASARYLGENTKLYVVYKGMIIERGHTERVIRQPRHPYTQALLSAMPILKGIERAGSDRFVLTSQFRQSVQEPAGCLFADRCPFSQPVCRDKRPELTAEGEGASACFFPKVRKVAAVAVNQGV
ncbi:ABC transporter ATP-binding protein [Sporolactobacillus sp. THM19-2]|jgi:peptide/nickel transport system ATP-binding protein|uniref:ABC transporter ATP-binding protein n=1 Tax=Sporolactobacillus sp. THM19-2 TaxID=2511171 RepID=UPI0010203A3A|nr:ABC transporter ATP-binding protein [Sporolactobacillus sp. THM19-2]RYL94475.1 ABC transporter ATP-binding protein [Sporolactobacillus sp. THM19-2]